MEELMVINAPVDEEEYYGEYQSECVFDEIPPDDAFAADELSEALQDIEFCNYYSGKLWQINPKDYAFVEYQNHKADTAKPDLSRKYVSASHNNCISQKS